jgi:hypothetical protein
MPNVETLVWVLTGAVTIIASLSGIIWSMVRNEAKEQAEQIRGKADNDRLQEAEARWAQELNAVKEDGEKMINKLESRHDREMQQMAERLGEQIRTTETNILTQIRIMFEALRKE